MLYECRLIRTINNKGLQKQLFFREGDSAQQVREELEAFEWGPGKWHISPADEENEECDQWS